MQNLIANRSIVANFHSENFFFGRNRLDIIFFGTFDTQLRSLGGPRHFLEKSSFDIFFDFFFFYLPAYLPTYLPTYYLPTCLPTYLPTTYLPAYLPAHLPTYHYAAPVTLIRSRPL